MKIQLIYPDIFWTGYPGDYYNGIAYIAASLKQAGHDVSLFHVIKDFKKENFLKFIENDADMFAISSTTFQFQYVEKWASWIKEKLDIPIICGGVHATLYPLDMLNNPSIDMVCVGEGEAPLVELANGNRPENIENIYSKKNGEIIENKIRPLIENLNTLPFPDRKIFDFKNILYSREGIAMFMASRGCPYKCSYCCNHALSKILGKNYVRFRSPELVIEEMENTLNDFSFINQIAMDDDILPLKKEWFRKFAELYTKKIGLPWGCNVRANLIDEEVVEILSSSNCKEVRMGIESGDSEIRNKILNRNMSDAAIESAARLIKKANLKLYIFNMVGIPAESIDNMLSTIKMNAKIKADNTQVSICYAFPGTTLYESTTDMPNIFMTEEKVLSYFNGTNIKSKKSDFYYIYSFKVFFKYIVKIYRSGIPQRILDALFKNRIIILFIYPLAKLAQKYLDLKRYLKFRNAKQ